MLAGALMVEGGSGPDASGPRVMLSGSKPATATTSWTAARSSTRSLAAPAPTSSAATPAATISSTSTAPSATASKAALETTVHGGAGAERWTGRGLDVLHAGAGADVLLARRRARRRRLRPLGRLRAAPPGRQRGGRRPRRGRVVRAHRPLGPGRLELAPVERVGTHRLRLVVSCSGRRTCSGRARCEATVAGPLSAAGVRYASRLAPTCSCRWAQPARLDAALRFPRAPGHARRPRAEADARSSASVKRRDAGSSPPSHSVTTTSSPRGRSFMQT